MYLGIDQSLTATGICLLDGDMNILSCRTITVGKMIGVQRINSILEQIGEVLMNPVLQSTLNDPHGPNFYVAREGYSFASNSNSAYQIGELGGCINRFMWKFSQEHKRTRMFCLPPTTVKKICLGKGNIKKDSHYLLTVFDKIGIKFEDDNQADAYMLAHSIKIFHDIIYDSSIVSSLSTTQKSAIIPKSTKKKRRLTEKVYSELGNEEIQTLLRESMNSKIYGVF